MNDSTLADLTGASALDGTELLYAVQNGADRKVTGTQIKNLAQAGMATQDALTEGLAVKADASAVAAKETIGTYTAGINTQAGTAYTLALGDVGKLVEMNSASANVLTVPANASVAIAVGSRIDIAQVGAGQTTVTAAGGVTLRSSGVKRKLTGQYSGATLIKRGADDWLLLGDLSA